MTHTLVAGGLFAWLAIAFALAHRAEARLGSRSDARGEVDAAAPPGSGRQPARFPSLAVTAAALVIVLALLARPLPGALLCGVACIALIAAAAGDARTGYLFDAITLPAALLVAALALWTGRTESAAYGVLLLVGVFGMIVLVSRGRWLGLGDVKALYAVGAAFGPFESLIAVFAASLCGIAAAALAGRFRRGAELRFGPHLAMGAAFTLVAGRPLVHAWTGI